MIDLTAYFDEATKIAKRRQRPPVPVGGKKEYTRGDAGPFLRSAGLIVAGGAAGTAVGGATGYGVRKLLLRRFLEKNPAERARYMRKLPSRAGIVGGILGAGAMSIPLLAAAEREDYMRKARKKARRRLPRSRS